MKKIVVFWLILMAICLFGSVSESALKVPVPESQQKVEIKPVEPAATELIPASVLESIEWRVRRGENLTKIARRYAEYRGQRQLDGFVDQIIELNRDGPCIKNKDLILAGCQIKIPAYLKSQVSVQSGFNEKIFEDNVNLGYKRGYEEGVGIGKKATSDGIILFFVAIVLLILLCFVTWRACKELEAKRMAEKDKNALDGLYKQICQKNSENELKIVGLQAKNSALAGDITVTKCGLDKTTAELERVRTAKQNAELEIDRLGDIIRENAEEMGRKSASLLNARKEILDLNSLIATYDARWQSSVEERRDLNATIVSLQSIVDSFKRIKVGAPYQFQSRDNGVISDGFTIVEIGYDAEGVPFIAKIQCNEKSCGAVDVKPQMSNANSHYWKHKGTSQTEKPNE